MNRVVVTGTHPSWAPHQKVVRRVAYATLRLLKRNSCYFEVVLLGSDAMRTLNKRWRGVDAVTNVLSFVHPSSVMLPPARLRYLGEVFICPSYLARCKQDLTHMVVHGVLHLCGFDHLGARDRMRMEKKESAVLLRLGKARRGNSCL